jgi:hypothetical protein
MDGGISYFSSIILFVAKYRVFGLLYTEQPVVCTWHGSFDELNLNAGQIDPTLWSPSVALHLYKEEFIRRGIKEITMRDLR